MKPNMQSMPLGNNKPSILDKETKIILDSYEQEFGSEDSQNKPKKTPPIFVRGGVQAADQKTLIEDKDKGAYYTPNMQYFQQTQDEILEQKQDIQKQKKDEKTRYVVDEFFCLLKQKNDKQQFQKQQQTNKEKSIPIIKQLEKRDLFRESFYDTMDNLKRYQSHVSNEHNKQNICLQNLELQQDETFLYSVFNKFGQIQQIKRRAIYFPEQLEAEIICYIKYEDSSSAKKALESLLQQRHQIKMTGRYGEEPESELANLYQMISQQNQSSSFQFQYRIQQPEIIFQQIFHQKGLKIKRKKK
ncbi:ubiquitin interaction motif family protein, putative [Ichthyophthirius multifiliis]|uniref:Ubiquitin interaction motif family protein, putative n=1 Tax=Ichthyophthirius multifiliis TaxID=5932 RepID=G0QMS9_ICHMU|nr:ubiquitin interaction motif family protein, putative [Ichthyophthirius multifiliis]EGR33482.1 ubiquitin interaction motif family protein, putative [Ichthyophthirius multifiliis]|eukprot:XP_004037468.1 ubiquitin interaction motif family protein, putative [Ichthyophthirius multifiliis]